MQTYFSSPRKLIRYRICTAHSGLSWWAALLVACTTPAPRTADSVAIGESSIPTGSVSVPVSPTPNSADMSARSDTGIVLRTDKSSYKAGEKITLTLVNSTGSSYAYNPCTRTVERESGGQWTEMREDRICTMVAWILDPGSTRSGDSELPAAVEPGRYRVIIRLTEEGSGPPARAVRAVSQPIDIVR